ncbi:MAG TPA: 30S ribosomal protein S4 [Candidatus Thermoplasmatota archaeon]|jgi:small subunit ribosomal protein S4|nr:30S ribosomal protein S4 [Candidatus Thermoplasmatota archaeon]
MGDPKFSRQQYETPTHPWQAARIAAENDIIRKYGLKNKTEVWKAQSKVRRFRQQARSLLARQFTGEAQVKLETGQLLGRLQRMGILSEGAKLDDVLSLNLEAVLARRLETFVYHKGLASSHKHARQLITHNHVLVGGRIVNVPGYLVPRGAEESIVYAPHSPLTNEAHPMRPKARAPGEAGPEEAREREYQARKREFRRGGPGGRGRGPPRGGGGFGRGPPRGGPQPERTGPPLGLNQPPKPAEKAAEKPAEKPAEKKPEKSEGGA